MAKKFITIRGAKSHNFKLIDIQIPRDQLVVITGLRGFFGGLWAGSGGF